MATKRNELTKAPAADDIDVIIEEASDVVTGPSTLTHVTPVYQNVRLSKVVEYKGQIYRPGVVHVMDAATVTAMGANVLNSDGHPTEAFYK